MRFLRDLDACISSPEDCILSKLLFYKEGGSEKHTRDIASILKASWDLLDTTYIAGWALRLDVHGLWRQHLQAVGRIDAYPFDQP